MRFLTASLLLATSLAATAGGPPAIYDEGVDAKAAIQATLAEAEKAKVPVLVVFGANWCGICQSAQRTIGEALATHAPLRHLKIEDGRGRPLGRSFGIKLWPTLVMLRDGREVARVVRPGGTREIAEALERLDAPAAGT